MPRNDLKAYETLTARIPQALVDAARRYASQHHCTVSDMIRDSLQMYLDAEGANRMSIKEQEVRQGQTEVLQEVRRGHLSLAQALAAIPVRGHTEVRQNVSTPAVGSPEVLPGHTKVRPSQPAQPPEAKHRGRKPVLRPGILALLDEHTAGLTAAELKVYLGTEKHIGDTLAGMVRAQLLVKNGTGPGLRYQLATAEGN